MKVDREFIIRGKGEGLISSIFNFKSISLCTLNPFFGANDIK